MKRATDGMGDADLKRPRVAESCTEDLEVILRKVAEREAARRAKDFGTSDQLRDELRATGVDLIDKARIWLTSDGRCGLLSKERLGADQLQALVALRETERANKRFDVADCMRDLLRENGVSLDDKLGSWRTDDNRAGGSCGSRPSPSSAAAPVGRPEPSASHRGGAPGELEVSDLEVLVLVDQLVCARQRGDVCAHPSPLRHSPAPCAPVPPWRRMPPPGVLPSGRGCSLLTHHVRLALRFASPSSLRDDADGRPVRAAHAALFQRCRRR